MLSLLRNNYDTYVDHASSRREGHWIRLFLFIIVSISISMCSSVETSDVYSMMSTGITVLTGFTFTALFSDHALASSGLHVPQTENDRQDLIVLEQLSNNFRARSAYFILISISSVVLLCALSFEIDLRKVCSIVSIFQPFRCDDFVDHPAFNVIRRSFSSAAVFIYLESIYTFYRMAETILSILDRRRDYLKNR